MSGDAAGSLVRTNGFQVSSVPTAWLFLVAQRDVVELELALTGTHRLRIVSVGQSLVAFSYLRGGGVSPARKMSIQQGAGR